MTPEFQRGRVVSAIQSDPSASASAIRQLAETDGGGG
jgi:hypothetical protein